MPLFKGFSGFFCLLLQALQVPHLAPFRGHIRDLRASPYKLPHSRSLPKGSGSIVVAT